MRLLNATAETPRRRGKCREENTHFFSLFSRRLGVSAVVFLILLTCCAARADVKPAALFGDHMVLQAESAIPVWGWADPGEAVSVSIDGQKKTATAGADGKWTVTVDQLRSDAPTEMTIAGKNSTTIKDVLVGEVWLASGQSNMDFTVSKKVKSFAGTQNEDEEIAAANFPQIRMFTVALKMADEPQADVVGEWKVCSPETVPGFSAVGYFFARELHQARHVPVGIITSSYGAQHGTVLDQPRESCRRCAVSKRFSKTTPPPPRNGIRATHTANATRARPRRAAQSASGSAQPRPAVERPDQAASAVSRFAARSGIRANRSSAGDALYLPLMQTLISSWRKRWASRIFPFLFVQLAGYRAPATQPLRAGLSRACANRSCVRSTLPTPRWPSPLTLAMRKSPSEKQTGSGQKDSRWPRGQQFMARRSNTPGRLLIR
jgi:sialate O-acetylesterase